jgi:hypothetical protein
MWNDIRSVCLAWLWLWVVERMEQSSWPNITETKRLLEIPIAAVVQDKVMMVDMVVMIVAAVVVVVKGMGAAEEIAVVLARNPLMVVNTMLEREELLVVQLEEVPQKVLAALIHKSNNMATNHR